jgi:exodeoxyribonuclease V alpha subunit
MTTETAFNQLDRFTDIDRHFADFLLRLEGTQDRRLWLAAALASNATQSGNVCIDLGAIAGKPILVEDARTTGNACAPELSDWMNVLTRSVVVGGPGDFRPLVLDQANRLYLCRYWKYEQQVAKLLKQLAASDLRAFDATALREGLSRLFPPRDPDELDWQRLAAVTAVLRRFSLITGGPGTGKTSTVLRILALLLSQPGHERLRIALAAPTGKAAARLKEAVKHSKDTLEVSPEVLARIPEEAFTLHRLLGFVPGSRVFRHNRKNPLPFEMIVVDEASMVDLPLMAKLLDAVPPGARLLLLGDREQLASVEPGAVFGDICSVAESAGRSEGFRECIKPYRLDLPASSSPNGGGPLQDSMTVLRRSYRFGTDSGIGQLSRSIQAGDGDTTIHLLSTKGLPDVIWEDGANPTSLQNRLERWILEAYAGCLQAGSPEEAFTLFARSRILCAVRRGPFGVAFINSVAEDALARKGLVRSRGAWYRGRPVMMNRNDYQIRLFNGDIGVAWEDSPRAQSGPAQIGVMFPSESGEMRRILPSRLPEHETVYAMTVHKAQGSEFDRVLLILPDQASAALTREMLYTAVTRARKHLEIWARRETIEASIQRRVTRHSGLREALSRG